MTQPDLFAPDPDPAQEVYALSLQQQWQADLDTLAEQGRIPNWLEIGDALQKDERRVLELIEENFGWIERENQVTHEHHDTSGLFPVVETITEIEPVITSMAGFISHGNAKAVINRLLQYGWVSRSVDQETGLNRLDITRRGRWIMDMAERDEWFSEGDG